MDTPPASPVRILPAAAADGVLDALAAHAPPMAMLGADGALHWCSRSFAALWAGRPVDELASCADGAEFAARAVDGSSRAWCLRLHPLPDGGRLVRAEPLGDVQALSTQLQVALDLGRIGLWRIDLAQQRLLLDARGREITGLGFDPAGIALDHARTHVHPDDRALAELSASRTLRSGVPTDVVMRFLHPDGGWRHLLLRRALQRDAEGRPVGFVGVVMDASARVQQQEVADRFARRLESATEAARIGLWSSQTGSELPQWNRRMFLLFGLPPAEPPPALEPWLARCVHEDDRERTRDAVVGWWRRGTGSEEIEFRVVRPSDGAVRWLVVRGRIERVADGRRHAEGVMLDTTAQHETLARLRESIARMELTTQALGLGTATWDVGDSRVRWDDQMFSLRGVVSPARSVQRDEVAGYVHPEDRARVTSEQDGHLARGSPWRLEFRVLLADGRTRWLSSHAVPVFDDAGGLVRWIGVNWDCTDSRLAAQALHERQLAVAESQAKSAAMSRISHELRTPLNAMLGFTDLLRDAEAAGDAERRSRWLAHVEDAGRHLLALIDDVLELTRAQIGRLRVEAQPLRCRDLLDTTLPLVAAAAQARAVTLRVDAAEGVVLADPVRLRQVLVNLLSNAIKYNRPGGNVRVACTDDGTRIAIRVADTGAGIAADRLPDAFEPFARLGAEAGSIEGSGLGLAIVKVLVETMGGTVLVASRVGSGSEFTVHLPRAQPQTESTARPAAQASLAAAGRRAAAPPAGASVHRVVYVEDNPINALVIREMLLHRPAIELEIAESGSRGVAAAIADPPDLMLVDIQLPDIDGFAVLAALRADPRTAAVPCVALSANATREDVAAALAAGFADYWTKPVEFGRFLADVDAMLARHGAGSRSAPAA